MWHLIIRGYNQKYGFAIEQKSPMETQGAQFAVVSDKNHYL